MLSDISIEDVSADSKPKKSWTGLDYLSEVTRVASIKYDREIAMQKYSTSSRRQRLMKEKALKKPILDYDDDDDDKAIKNERSAKNQKSVIIKKNKKKKDKKLQNNNNNKKKKDKKARRGPEPPPDMPLRMKMKVSEMGGGSETLVLVIQKELTKTDCNKGQNRLSIPISEVRNEFLRQDEKAELKMRDGGGKLIGIQVSLIDPQLDDWKTKLKMWDMEKKAVWDMEKKAKSSKTSSIYTLVNPWNDIVDKNNFHKGVVVQVWSFRVASELRLAIVKLPQTRPDDVASTSSSGTPAEEGTSSTTTTTTGADMAFDIQE